MERWATSPTFPLSLAALGSLIVLALIALRAPVDSAVALGLGAYAAGLALRNWWVTEDERPLLAEELQGMHDTLDALRAEADELRQMANDLASILEETVEQDQAARGLEIDEMNGVFTARLTELETRIAALSAAAAAAPATDAPDAEAAAAQMKAQAQAQAKAEVDAVKAEMEARISKLAQALSLAVEQMRRQEARIVAAETTAAPAPAAEPSRSESTAPTPSAADAAAADPSPSTAAERSAPTHTLVERPATAPRHSPTVETPTRSKTASRLEALRASRAAPTALADAKPAGTAADDKPDAAAPERPRPERAPAAHAAPSQAVPSQAAPSQASPSAARPRRSAIAVTPVMALDGSAAKHLRITSADASAQDALDLVEGVRGSGRELTVFYRVAADAARDGRLLRGPLARARLAGATEDAAPALALEIAQEDFAAFTRDAAAVRRLTATGAALAVTDIADWNMDISEMARFGVRYVILDAEDLLTRAEDAAAAGRLLATFQRFGLELIVAQVGDDAVRARLISYGAPCGYGAALAQEHSVELPASAEARAAQGRAEGRAERPAALSPSRDDGAFAPSAEGPAIRPEIAAFASRVAGRARSSSSDAPR